MKGRVSHWFSLMALGCMTTAPVVGPAAAKTHEITCLFSAAACFEEAREVCKGDYQILTFSTPNPDFGPPVSSGGANHRPTMDLYEMEVRCGRSSESTSNTPVAVLAKSGAPTGAGGIRFGQTEAEIQTACEAKQYAWKRTEDTATCSGLLDDVGYPGRTRVTFCAEKVCEIRLNLDLLGSEEPPNLLAEYVNIHQVLAEKYEDPQFGAARAFGKCKEDLLSCLKDGTVKLKSNWRWKNGARLSLTIFEHEDKPITYLEYVSGKQGKNSGL